jgi:hypothetical protein
MDWQIDIKIFIPCVHMQDNIIRKMKPDCFYKCSYPIVWLAYNFRLQLIPKEEILVRFDKVLKVAKLKSPGNACTPMIQLEHSDCQI